MSKTALLVITDGSEEMEAVITADVLRRAKVDVTVAGLKRAQTVKCSRGINIVPDKALKDCTSEYDVVILPGGLDGAHAFADSNEIKELLQKQEKSGRLIAAICAAPIALKSHGVCLNRRLTSHPCKADDFINSDKYSYGEDRVVVDGKLITSRAPGTAFEFALAIVKKLCGQEKVNEITPGMILKL